MKESVGKRLKECRTAMGLSQRELAKMLGVAQPVYQRFEKGTYECNYWQLVKLCDIFDVSCDYILGRNEYY